MPNEQPDSPVDEIISASEMARTSAHGPESAGEVAGSSWLSRFLKNNFVQIRLAFLICMLT